MENRFKDVLESEILDRIIPKSETSKITGLSEVTIWRLENQGKFPKRRQLSANRVGHLLSEVLRWVKSRPAIGSNEKPKRDVT